MFFWGEIFLLYPCFAKRFFFVFVVISNIAMNLKRLLAKQMGNKAPNNRPPRRFLSACPFPFPFHWRHLSPVVVLGQFDRKQLFIPFSALLGSMLRDAL